MKKFFLLGLLISLLLNRGAVVATPAFPAAFAPVLDTLRTRVSIPVLLPTGVPLETVSPTGAPLPSGTVVRDGKFSRFYAYPATAESDRYEVSLDLSPDCRGVSACSFGSIGGERLGARTPGIPPEYTAALENWKDPNLRRVPRSGEAPRTVALNGGVTGYFVPYICYNSCSDSRIIWDWRGVRYSFAIKAASLDTVRRMVTGARVAR